MVAFQIDDADGKPVTDLKLNARLVAKLITASYRSGGNQAVINNPVNIFRDPEFLALNPGVDLAGRRAGQPSAASSATSPTPPLRSPVGSRPTPTLAAFMAGNPDPWGMKVNTNYKAVPLPFDNFPLLDQLHVGHVRARSRSSTRWPGSCRSRASPAPSPSVEDGVNVATSRRARTPADVR